MTSSYHVTHREFHVKGLYNVARGLLNDRDFYVNDRYNDRDQLDVNHGNFFMLSGGQKRGKKRGARSAKKKEEEKRERRGRLPWP